MTLRNAMIVLPVLLSAPLAMADVSFTQVRAAPGGEKNHIQILTSLYGGTWDTLGLSPRDYSNGSVSVIRSADFGIAGRQQLGMGGTPVTDQEWAGGNTKVTARAKYAGDRHQFGWINDAGSGAFSPIVSTTDFNNTIELSVGPSFRWALNDLTTGKMWTSRAADNLDSGGAARDQLVTYRVYGTESAEAVWLLFWEDRIGSGADYDYNDAVIEIRTSEIVPAPGAGALAGATGMLMTRRRRR